MLQTLNGWVQGMGWPPCGKTMVHWFSTRERGLVGVGLERRRTTSAEALVANFALVGVTLFHDWGAKFYFNARSRPRAIGVYFLLHDTPQSCGLPPVEEYKDDYPEGYSDAHEQTFGFSEIFLEHVLPNATCGRSRSRTRSSTSCATES